MTDGAAHRSTSSGLVEVQHMSHRCAQFQCLLLAVGMTRTMAVDRQPSDGAAHISWFEITKGACVMVVMVKL